jgi:hypothetical protein
MTGTVATLDPPVHFPQRRKVPWPAKPVKKKEKKENTQPTHCTLEKEIRTLPRWPCQKNKKKKSLEKNSNDFGFPFFSSREAK